MISSEGLSRFRSGPSHPSSAVHNASAAFDKAIRQLESRQAERGRNIKAVRRTGITGVIQNFQNLPRAES